MCQVRCICRANNLLAGTPPVPGACPGIGQLKTVINHLGIDASKQVVVYDDEGGGWAGRLAWTLDLLGLPNWSYLNGGIVPWIKEGFATEAGVVQPKSNDIEISFANPDVRIELEQILAALDDPNFAIWDARSPGEYSGNMVPRCPRWSYSRSYQSGVDRTHGSKQKPAPAHRCPATIG